jgi:hypothetical protein
MSEAKLPIASEAIKVAEFRQILMWPLALDMAKAPSSETMASLVIREAEHLVREQQQLWRPVKDPLFHLQHEVGGKDSDPNHRQEPYAEFVYFHDFVQRFLYPKDAKPEQALLHLFRRTDIQGVRISQWVGSGMKEFTLKVDRCNLYLFPVGVAMLAVEVTSIADHPEGLLLSEVLYLQDTFRRCYTPYFDGQDARGVPSSVQWLGANGTSIGMPSLPQSLNAARDFAVLNRQPPMFSHWMDLLPLNVPGRVGHNDTSSNMWRHIVDERIPIMTYVRLAEVKAADGTAEFAGKNLERVERGDLTRLCFADTPGPAGSYPYDEEFLSKFDDENCYGRYKSWGTLHMFSGYSYAVIVAEGKDRERNPYNEIIVHHFRHMYFQMAMIAHMEQAAYLAFSSRVSQAVADASAAKQLRSLAFKERIVSIQEEFLRFVQLFRFTGLSNQIQAKEMFDLWRKHLRLQPLYEDVRDELNSATAFLFAAESRQQTTAATRLNKIAIAGVLLSLVFSFLGMNLIWDAESIKAMLGQVADVDNKRVWSLWNTVSLGVAGFGFTLSVFAGLGLTFVMRWFESETTPKPSFNVRVRRWIGLSTSGDPGEKEIEQFLRRMTRFGVVLFMWGALIGWGYPNLAPHRIVLGMVAVLITFGMLVLPWLLRSKWSATNDSSR